MYLYPHNIAFYCVYTNITLNFSVSVSPRLPVEKRIAENIYFGPLVFKIIYIS